MLLELEKTYLAKYLPENLFDGTSKEIIDHYIPKDSDHAKLRIRKNGSKYEMTKKEPVNGDPSAQHEYTIPLTPSEYQALASLPAKIVHKIRYYYDYQGFQAEFDVFQGDLKGLVFIDFEFEDETTKDSFCMPEFCLVDVTTEECIAGGVLCGKTYGEIQGKLEKFDYRKMVSSHL